MVQSVEPTTNGAIIEEVQVTEIVEETSMAIDTDKPVVQEKVVVIQADAGAQPAPSTHSLDSAHETGGNPQTFSDEQLLLGVTQPILA